MKIPLCFIVFLLLPVVKLRPTVAGSMVSNWRLCSPQLWDIQSTTRFCYRHNDISIKALGEKGRSISSFTSTVQLPI